MGTYSLIDCVSNSVDYIGADMSCFESISSNQQSAERRSRSLPTAPYFCRRANGVARIPPKSAPLCCGNIYCPPGTSRGQARLGIWGVGDNRCRALLDECPVTQSSCRISSDFFSRANIGYANAARPSAALLSCPTRLDVK